MSRHSLKTHSAAGLIAVLLHAFMLGVLLHQPRRDLLPAIAAPADPQTAWIPLAPAATETPAPGLKITPAVTQLPTFEILPPDIPEFSDEAESAADGVPSYVRYVGEVTARIQRAWDAPVSEREQHCRLRIEVGPDGEVRTLTAQLCDAEPRLQASITEAIRRAGPLPSLAERGVAGDLLLDFNVSAANAEGIRSSVQPADAAL